MRSISRIDGEKLKLARQKAGMSQMELAKYLNVSINTYIFWERSVSNPNEGIRSEVQEFINKYVS